MSDSEFVFLWGNPPEKFLVKSSLTGIGWNIESLMANLGPHEFLYVKEGQVMKRNSERQILMRHSSTVTMRHKHDGCWELAQNDDDILYIEQDDMETLVNALSGFREEWFPSFGSTIGTIVFSHGTNEITVRRTARQTIELISIDETGDTDIISVIASDLRHLIGAVRYWWTRRSDEMEIDNSDLTIRVVSFPADEMEEHYHQYLDHMTRASASAEENSVAFCDCAACQEIRLCMAVANSWYQAKNVLRNVKETLDAIAKAFGGTVR